MSNKKNKNRTGRGLDALLGGATISLATPGQAFAPTEGIPTSAPSSDIIREIGLDLIDANPNQPRTQFEEEGLAELAQSVRELGIITPITVRQTDEERYQIISGERRCRAARMAELTAIPAYVMEADDRDMQIMALVENIQREDLNPIDIAAGYQNLIEKYDLTQENVSSMVGKKRASITNYLRLLKLPPQIQNAVRTQAISMGHAKALMSIENADVQKDIARKIEQQQLSVRQVEELAKALPKPQQLTIAVNLIDEETQKMLSLLKRVFDHHLSGKTTLKSNADGSSRLIIDLKSSEDIQFMLNKFAAD